MNANTMNEAEEDTITDCGTIDLTNSTLSTVNWANINSLNYGTYTINTAPNAAGTNFQFYQPTITTTSNPSSLEVKGDANFEGDIKFKGRSLEKLLQQIEDRLLILQPDPKKLEKYEALRKAYEHYKLLEKLIQED